VNSVTQVATSDEIAPQLTPLDELLYDADSRSEVDSILDSMEAPVQLQTAAFSSSI
jgi:hypothetical protein